MVARRPAKKTAAKKTAARRPAPEPVEEETSTRRGRTPDLGKYELFAEWALETDGMVLDPEQAMYTITNYKHFQASDINREYNERKSAEIAERRANRKAAREDRESAREEKTTAPAKKAAGRKSAAAASAPATAKKSTPAKKATAKKATARRTPRAAQEAF